MSDHAEGEIIRQPLDTEGANPAVQLVELIAEIEETDPVTLPTMYDCVDGMLDDLFSEPPSDEAQLTVEFSYQAYRVTVEQDGAAKFVKID